MRSSAQGKSNSNHYNKFYAGEGWKTSLKSTSAEILMIADLLKWQPGRKVLDLGCGQGLQTDVLRTLGFDVIGIDASHVGIQRAKKAHPDSSYICSDIADWEPSTSFDSIYCRCMSWFHYELNGISRKGINVPYEVARFFTWLPSGGEFVLQISTDFSGEDTLESGGVLNNTLHAYYDLFALFGEILFTRDWKGNEVDADKKPASGIILAVQKP